MAAKATGMSGGVVECLIYCRVSTGKQADGVSLDAQLRENRAYASRQDGWVLGKEYVDVLSGKRDDRPDYQRLLTDIRTLSSAGRRVAVVVWRLDRLGRTMLERVRSREELAALGCETHSAMEGGLVSDLVANILASVAQEEVRALGERVRGALRQIESAGWCKVAHPPLGYTSRDASAEEQADGAPRRVLAVDERQAVVVREAFRKIAAGASTRAVSRWLAGLPAEDRGGRSWDRLPTYRMLTNTVYIARQDADEGIDPLSLPVQKWPAIITDAEWQAAQAGLRLNARLRHRAATRHLLTGLIRCPKADCTGRLTGHAEEPSGAQTWTARVRYRCDRHRPGYRCTATLPAVCLEQDTMRQVTALLDATAVDGELRTGLRREWDALRGAVPNKRDDRERRALDLRASLEQGRKRLARAATMLVDGVLDRAGYDAMRETTEADMAAAAAKLDRLDGAVSAAPVLPPLDEIMAMIGSWKTAMAAADVDLRRQVLVELVAHIDTVKRGHGKYDVRISWTTTGETLRSLVATLATAA
jgi:DNA invertase Pin-like site-specific DNA recombinase